jgi:hypothetical protein
MSIPGEYPRWQKPKDVVRNYPLGQTKLWELASENEGLFRKIGRATVVDTQMLDNLFECLPPAKLKA